MARPRKQYKPRKLPSIVMRLKVDAVFSPIELALDALLATGTVETDEAGNPTFRNRLDGDTYALAPAMAGIVTMFEMWATRHGNPSPVVDMNELCGRISMGLAIDEDLVRRVLLSTTRLRALSFDMGAEEAADLVTQTQIRVELEKTTAVQEQQQ